MIEIYSSETARFKNRPLVDALIQFIQERKVAARIMVTRGVGGYYEDGEIASGRLEILSCNMPIRIDMILPEEETAQMVTVLEEMLVEGVVALRDLNVLIHKVKNSFFPRHLRVVDIMTRNPTFAEMESSLMDVMRSLLPSIFSGVPVVDEKKRPLGVITQGDLIRKGGVPLRPGLISELDLGVQEGLLKTLEGKIAKDIMTQPAITIKENQFLADAVDVMLSKGVKRLPVVAESGRLTGMVSRIDIFRTAMREAPDWSALEARSIRVDRMKQVGDLQRRDIHTVGPQAPISEVIRVIGQNDIQRVAVVDQSGRFLGLISDRDLLCYFKPEEEGLSGLIIRWKLAMNEVVQSEGSKKRFEETLARHVMRTHLITVTEATPLEEALRIMTEKALKRLPVVDDSGRFKGMVSRDSLLRTVYQ